MENILLHADGQRGGAGLNISPQQMNYYQKYERKPQLYVTKQKL